MPEYAIGSALCYTHFISQLRKQSATKNLVRTEDTAWVIKRIPPGTNAIVMIGLKERTVKVSLKRKCQIDKPTLSVDM